MVEASTMVKAANAYNQQKVNNVKLDQISRDFNVSKQLFHDVFLEANAAYNGNPANINNNITNDLKQAAVQTLNNVRSSLIKSEAMSAKALVGEANISDVVSSITEAEIALQGIMAIRDKLVTLYLDLTKMNI